MRKLPSILALLLAGATAAMAQKQTTIIGTILGHDGARMPKAHVHLTRMNAEKPLAAVEAGADGSFKVATSETGLMMLQFSGVDHRMHEVPLFIEKPANVALDVRLRPYRYDEITDVKIIGDFNDFDFRSAQSMDRQEDGTFVAEFETNAPIFMYQLLGVAEERSVNGTQSVDYIYDGGGDYRSVVKTSNGGVRIVFDPSKLVRTDAIASVRFVDPASQVARFSAIYSEMLERTEAYRSAVTAFKESGRDPKEFTYDWAPAMEKLTKGIAEEKDPLIRQALLYSYLDIPAKNGRKDAEIGRRTLKEIPPTSALWSINPGQVMDAIDLAGKGDDAQKYVQKVIDTHPDENVRAALLYDRIWEASMRKDKDAVQKLYTELTGKYGSTEYGKMAAAEFSPDRAVMAGKTVPAFSFASLDDPKVTYTSDELKGKVYLIDFWATWCGPCIGEMDNLHAAYEKYHPKGLEILSLSFDAKPEDVTKFRSARKWKMPWMHAFIDGNFKSDAAKSFEVRGIPKPVLVGADGRIIATEVDLRGENLEATLSKVFAGERMGAK